MVELCKILTIQGIFSFLFLCWLIGGTKYLGAEPMSIFSTAKSNNALLAPAGKMQGRMICHDVGKIVSRTCQIAILG